MVKALFVLFLLVFSLPTWAQTGSIDHWFMDEVFSYYVEPGSPEISEIERIHEGLQSGSALYGRLSESDGQAEVIYKMVGVKGDSSNGYTVYYKVTKMQVSRMGETDQGGQGFEAAPTQTEKLPHQSDSSSSGYHFGSGFGESLAGAGLAVGGETLIKSLFGSGLAQTYQSISDLEKEIGEKMKDIKSLKISLRGTASDLSVQLRSGIKIQDFPSLDPSKLPEIQIFESPVQQSLARYQWASKDHNFVTEAESIRKTLVETNINTDIDQGFYEIGEAALYEADHWSSIGREREAQLLLKVAKTSADVLVGWDPYTGVIRSTYEFVMGVNPFTGRELSRIERFFAGVGMLTFGYGAKLPRIYKVLKPLAMRLGQATQSTYRAVGTMLSKTGHGLIKTQRKINFLSAQNPKWGLGMTHVLKHFTEVDGSYSLARVDPSGNINIWMDHVLDISQLPPTRSWTEKGQKFLEIRSRVPKTDGSGLFNMGVRLAEAPDGSFDLVTVLTRNP